LTFHELGLLAEGDFRLSGCPEREMLFLPSMSASLKHISDALRLSTLKKYVLPLRGDA
jgi:hypothetical protein